MDPAKIEMHITSEPRNFCVVRAAAEAAALAFDLGREEAGQVKLAVTEALANVTNHGYKGQTDRPIRVTIWSAPDGGRPGVTIQIDDECQGVDLRKIKSRPLDEIRPGGLGVHIIRHTMDEVDYEQRPDGHGVCLRMRKLAKLKRPAQKG